MKGWEHGFGERGHSGGSEVCQVTSREQPALEVREYGGRAGVAIVEEDSIVTGPDSRVEADSVTHHGDDGCFWVGGAVEDVVKEAGEELVFGCAAEAV